MKFFKQARCNIIMVILLVLFVYSNPLALADGGADKPSPDKVLEMLKQGNERFINEKAELPHRSIERMKQAGKEDQGDHAYATVITCSDSRVPVELLFDAGIMDLFVVRVAGNVCNTDEIGSIEYGLAHVNTPVLVVLGHTQCGAVSAVTHAFQGKGHRLERNIPDLVGSIKPAVERASANHPHIEGDAVIPLAIEENVWQAIFNLFLESPATRNLVKEGKVKVVGAIYDVGTGKVNWLPEQKVEELLKKAEKSPDVATNPYAEQEGDSSIEYVTVEETEDFLDTPDEGGQDEPMQDEEQSSEEESEQTEHDQQGHEYMDRDDYDYSDYEHNTPG